MRVQHGNCFLFFPLFSGLASGRGVTQALEKYDELAFLWLIKMSFAPLLDPSCERERRDRRKANCCEQRNIITIRRRGEEERKWRWKSDPRVEFINLNWQFIHGRHNRVGATGGTVEGSTMLRGFPKTRWAHALNVFLRLTSIIHSRRISFEFSSRNEKNFSPDIYLSHISRRGWAKWNASPNRNRLIAIVSSLLDGIWLIILVGTAPWSWCVSPLDMDYRTSHKSFPVPTAGMQFPIICLDCGTYLRRYCHGSYNWKQNSKIVMTSEKFSTAHALCLSRNSSPHRPDVCN